MVLNRLRALGAIDLRDATGRELRPLLAQPKRLALLLYLSTASPRAFHRRDTLVALLWPELDTEHARNALRQALHFLRNGLGAAALPARAAEEVGIAPEFLAVDVAEFETALDAGELERALELYRGDLLPGFFITEAPAFERWLDERRTELRRRAAAAAWELSAAPEKAGDRGGAIRWGRRAVLLALDDETGVRRLLELHLRLGDRGGALRAYEEFSERLHKEFEVEPSAETQALIAEAREPVPAQSGRTGRVSPDSATPAPFAAPATRGRAWPPLATAAALFLVVATVGAMMVSRRGAPAMPTGQAVAVLPFPVRGRPDLAYLREGMVDLISAKLDGASGLRSVDPRAVLGAVQRAGVETPLDPARAGQVAAGLGARYFVVGDVVEIAGRININGALYTGATPQRVAVATVSGESTALFQLVDDLTGQLLAGLSRGQDTALTRLAAVTTQSLPALKSYLEGEQALRVGNDSRAAIAFRAAATLDTNFALAQYRLAVMSTWVPIREVPDAIVWATMATRHASRLTPLGRDLLSGYRAYKSINAHEAENTYQRITDSHPDNVEAWFMLGETRFHYAPLFGRSPQESHLPFQRVLELDPANPHAMLHLARLAARFGRIAELDSLARSYVERYPASERALEMRALQAFVHRDSTAHAAIVRETAGIGEFELSSIVQDAMWYAQDLDAGEALAAASLATTRNPITLRFIQRAFSDLSLARGQWRSEELTTLPRGAVDRDWWWESVALLASDPFFAVPRTRLVAIRDSIAARRPYPSSGLPNFPPDTALGSAMQTYLVGLLSARLGDSATASRAAATLAGMQAATAVAAGGPLAHALRAEIARSRGDLRSALRELDDFAFDLPAPGRNLAHWGVRERFLRAELLLALHRDAEALTWYESYPATYDTPYMAAAQLRQAQIQGHLGNRERQAFHLRRFIQLWSDCDAELRPRVDSARAMLAAHPLQ